MNSSKGNRKKKILAVYQLQTVHGRRNFSGFLEYANSKTDWEVTLAAPLENFDLRLFRKAEAAGIDGIVITMPGTGEAMRALFHSNIPVVFVNIPNVRLPARRSRVSFVYTDNEDIGRTGGEYMRTLGAAAYGFVGTPAGDFWSAERERGYHASVGSAGEYFAFGGGSLGAWIKKLPKPAAIMTAADFVASSVLHECRRLRISVPRQVSILGVDYTPSLGREKGLPLSSVTTDMASIGFRAGEELDRLIKSDVHSSPREIVVPAKGVVLRQSTARTCASTHLTAAIKAFIAANFMQDISVADITSGLGCSRRLAEIRFRQAEGRSIRQALEDARLDKAKGLLKANDITIGDVAKRCGFQSAERLSRLFHRKTGDTISHWRLIGQPRV